MRGINMDKIAEDRYKDLCDFFDNNPDTINAILGNQENFKAWLERLEWHVVECNKLSKQLRRQKGKLNEVKTNIFRCSCCGSLCWMGIDKYSYCPKCGADISERQTLTLEEWQNDFRSYVKELDIPRDDYNGIMEYIAEVPRFRSNAGEYWVNAAGYNCNANINKEQNNE